MAEYYMPGPGDTFLKRMWRWYKFNQRARPPFPRAIQIQTDSRCNADCVFCGWHDTKSLQPQGKMDEALFRKIVDECGRHWIGRISPYLMNEPLLDPNMPDKIAYINRRKKFLTKTKINSNGAMLDQGMSEGLVDAGLRHLWISVQGYSEETYKQSMGLSLTRVLGNIDTFLAVRTRKGKVLPKLTVTTLDTSIVHDELEYARKYWSDRDVNFKIHRVDNRSGKDMSPLGTDKPRLRRNCDLFLKQAYVIYTGEVILCCHDWRRSVVLGDLRTQSLHEIWNAPKFLELIRQYQAGDFRNLKICATCTTS